MKKTHWKKLKNPNFLGSWDLIDENGNYFKMSFTITKVDKESVHDGRGGQDECVIIYLKNAKPMILNATNLKLIAKMYGNFIEDWVGKSINLEVQQVKAFGGTHDALRISEKAIELTPTHPNWEKVKQAIISKSYTIEQVKKKYSINLENEKLLCLN